MSKAVRQRERSLEEFAEEVTSYHSKNGGMDVEMESHGAGLFLFYVMPDSDGLPLHVASWQGGKGWEFDWPETSYGKWIVLYQPLDFPDLTLHWESDEETADDAFREVIMRKPEVKPVFVHRGISPEEAYALYRKQLAETIPTAP